MASVLNGSSGGNTNPVTNQNRNAKGRARSSSLVMVTEVGGDEPENVVDRLGVGTNENAAWVNAPGECHHLCSPLGAIFTQYVYHRRLAHPSDPDPPRKGTRRRNTRNDARLQLDHREPRLHGCEPSEHLRDLSFTLTTALISHVSLRHWRTFRIYVSAPTGFGHEVNDCHVQVEHRRRIRRINFVGTD